MKFNAAESVLSFFYSPQDRLVSSEQRAAQVQTLSVQTIATLQQDLDLLLTLTHFTPKVCLCFALALGMRIKHVHIPPLERNAVCNIAIFRTSLTDPLS